MLEKYSCPVCDKPTVINDRTIEAGRVTLSDDDRGKKFATIRCYGECASEWSIERTALPAYLCSACESRHVDSGDNQNIKFWLYADTPFGMVDCDCGHSFNIPVQDKTAMDLRIQAAMSKGSPK